MAHRTVSARFLLAALLFVAALLPRGAAAQGARPALTSRLNVPAGTYSIPLQWLSQATPAGTEAHAALLLPVTVPGCPRTLYMQFDLGASYSLFYRDKLSALHARYPKAVPATDTATRLAGLDLRLGNLPLRGTDLVVRAFDSTGINWKDKAPIIIGTIGSDLLSGRLAAIDYAGGALRLSSDSVLPTGITMSDLVYTQGSLLFPVQLRGKRTLLYFDTGSSAFALLTDSSTCVAMALPGAAPRSYPVNSWGRTLTAHNYATADSVAIGGQQLPLRTATWMEGASAAQVDGMKRMGIGGMTGNKLFLGSVLLLDLKAKKFAVLPAGSRPIR